MLKPEENERICRVGAGTPMGALMRRYWLPALLSDEAATNEGPPVRVRLLGEDLVAFRNGNGTVAVAGARCREQIAAYPTWEGGGMVWAYLGPPEHRPPAPDFEVCRAPAAVRVTGKLLNQCNYLQALEGAVDSVHSGILHCDDLEDRRQLRGRRCDVEFDLTPYGLSGAAIHPLDDGRSYARSFHYVQPVHSIRGVKYDRYGAKDPNPLIVGQIYVPIDDESCWVYAYAYAAFPESPPSAEFFSLVLKAWGCAPHPDGFVHERNLRNDYLIDRKLQKTTSFSGLIGMNVQDFAVQEGMGQICDRSKEHLAVSDHVIIALRRLLFEGMDAVGSGAPLRGTDAVTYRDVRASDELIETGTDWRPILRADLVARF